MSRTYTADIFAFRSPYTNLNDIDANNPIKSLCLTTIDMSDSGYTLVGKGTATVTLQSRDEIVGNEIASLKLRAESIKSQAMAQVREIESQIRNLQALTFEAA